MSSALLRHNCLQCSPRQQITHLSRRPCCSMHTIAAIPCSSLRLGHRRQHGVSSRGNRQVTTMGLFGLGIPELAIIAGVSVLLFGPSKLPGLGKELGKTVKSFQSAAKEFETELKNAADDTAKKTLPDDDAKR